MVNVDDSCRINFLNNNCFDQISTEKLYYRVCLNYKIFEDKLPC